MMAERARWWGGLAFAAALALSWWVAARPAPLPGDVRLTHWVQSQEWFASAADAVNPLGSPAHWPILGAVTGAVIIVARARRLPVIPPCTALAAAAMLRPLSQALKRLVESPRPDASFGVSVDHVRASYGFPSGHVFADVLLYGAMAWAISSVAGRRAARAAWATATLIVVLAGPARVYVGAHWPSDVVGGYLWGTAALALAVVAGDLTRRWTRPAPGTPRDAHGRSAPGG